MSAIKIQVSGYKPPAHVRYEDNGLYAGWYARFRRQGRLRKVALSTWERDDLSAALTEAATLLRCSLDRIRSDNPQDSQTYSSVGGRAA